MIDILAPSATSSSRRRQQKPYLHQWLQEACLCDDLPILIFPSVLSSQESVRAVHLQPTVFGAQLPSLLPGVGFQTDAVLLPQRISRQESPRDPY